MGKFKVFMIMPFQDEFFEVYTMLQKEFSEKFEFSNAGDEDNQQNILKDIIQPICEADIILADLTGLNPNVLYELGVAHTLNKKCITITKDDLNSLPFDLKQYRSKNYDTHFTKFAELIVYLRKHLEGAVDNSVVFGNPVADFMKDYKEIKIANTNTLKTQVDEDKGFLDFVADIEDDMSDMTANIIDLTSELNVMTTGINESTKKINSVTGGGKASFARKEARKVADLTINFQKILNEYNGKNTDIWNRVEHNTVGLLDSSFTTKKDNIDDLNKFLKGFADFQGSIKQSNDGVSSFKEALAQNKGIERSLTQSIRALEEELETYLTSMQQIVASTERIIDKATLLKLKL